MIDYLLIAHQPSEISSYFEKVGSYMHKKFDVLEKLVKQQTEKMENEEKLKKNRMTEFEKQLKEL